VKLEPRPISGIRLQDAVLCANCETIYDFSLSEWCPYCASHQLLRVATQFGGTAIADVVAVEVETKQRKRKANIVQIRKEA
jgi:hypothetical protein